MTTAQRTTDERTGTRYYTYPPTGEQFASVTTITGATCDKSLYLSPWYARRAAEYAVDNLEPSPPCSPRAGVLTPWR